MKIRNENKGWLRRFNKENEVLIFIDLKFVYFRIGLKNSLWFLIKWYEITIEFNIKDMEWNEIGKMSKKNKIKLENKKM